MARRAHFKIPWRVDGTYSCTVSVEVTDFGTSYFRVRPHRRRRGYEMALADVAQIVLEHVVKVEKGFAKKKRAKTR